MASGECGGADPALREAALAAGAKQVNEGPLEPIDAIRQFGRCATRELEVLADRPGPVVQAELWALARDWKLKPSLGAHRDDLGARLGPTTGARARHPPESRLPH